MTKSNRHPAIEKLYAFDAGALSASETRDTEVHVAECMRCREELELLRSFNLIDENAEVPERSGALRAAFRERVRRMDPMDRPRGPRRRRAWAAGLMAAAAALLVAGITQLTPRSPAPDPGTLLRGEGDPISVEVTSAGAARQWYVSWSGPTAWNISEARMAVLDAAGTEVHTAATAKSPYRLSLPADTVRKVLFLRVEVTAPDGRTVAGRLVPLTDSGD